MKNPFIKLVSSVERRVEKSHVIDTVLEKRDDGVYVRDVYENNIVSDEEVRLDADPEDTEIVDEAHRLYRREKGIVEEAELDA